MGMTESSIYLFFCPSGSKFYMDLTCFEFVKKYSVREIPVITKYLSQYLENLKTL